LSVKSAAPPPLENSQERRFQAAQAEYPFYAFLPVSRAGRVWYDCWAVRTGETYEVSPFDCTCWDYRTRGQRYGLQCKHILMLEMCLQQGDLCRESRVVGGGCDAAPL
jgi:hypothetical protein